MKQTEEDLRFAASFADRLSPHVAKERERGLTLGQIARKLGVTEPALKKYLRGRTTPCLRTVVLAYGTYGVSVQYGKVDIAKKISSKGKRAQTGEKSDVQLVLPFEITAPRLTDGFDLKLSPTGVSRYQLQLTVRAAKSRSGGN